MSILLGLITYLFFGLIFVFVIHRYVTGLYNWVIMLFWPLFIYALYGDIIVGMHLKECDKCKNGGFPCSLLRNRC